MYLSTSFLSTSFLSTSFLIIIFLIMLKKYWSYIFDDQIGEWNGVSIYSNKHYKNGENINNYYNGVFTGIKWQCVEYARRYLQITRGITFDNVDYAFQIPQANFTALNGKNVQKTNDIKIGSLVIWPKYYKNNAPDGHVAVISSIHQNGIYVAEQNYDDKTFPRFIDWNDLNNVTIIYALYF